MILNHPQCIILHKVLWRERERERESSEHISDITVQINGKYTFINAFNVMH